MLIIKSLSVLSPSNSYSLLFNSKQPLFVYVFSSFSSLAKTSKEVQNPALFHYLKKNFKFSETQALSISNRFSHIKSSKKPQSVVQFLQNLGFLNSHIQSAVFASPQILFSNVDRCLKPKIEFFKDLGLVGDELSKFISKNSTLLTASLEKKLVPRVEILKNILSDDVNNKDLVKVINRCNWIVSKKPESVLLSNVAFLESCGIVGFQLSRLLRRLPRLFLMQESMLRELVSRALNMGFSVNSRMLVHALYTVSGLSDKTFERKFGTLKNFGFSEHECLEMFRKAPNMLRTSEEKLKLGVDFYLNTVKFKKEVLVRRPAILMFSMEERVIPRYNVFEIMKLKKLLNKEPNFISMLNLTEEEFLHKFISRFPDEAEELLVAYKGQSLDSSSEEEKC